MQRPIFRIDNFSIGYNGKVLVKNLSFSIYEGKKYLLYGKSGKGKSSILKALLGFFHFYEGEIYFNEELLDDKNVWKIRKIVSYVPQEIDIGSGRVLSIIEEIMDAKINSKIKGWRDRISEFLEFLELDESLLDNNFENLSGGEKQRIVLLISLLLDRKIFFLDEPTASLDRKLKKKIVEYFLDSPYTVLAISHDEEWLREDKMEIIRL